MSRKRGRGGDGTPSNRPIKVGEVIRQELSSMLSDGTVKDPRLDAAMATITGVDMSPDLQHGKVYVSIYNEDPEVRKTVMDGLRSAAPRFRRALGGRIRLRYTPELRFESDDSIAYGANIESILKDIQPSPVDAEVDDAKPEAEDADATEADQAEEGDEGGLAIFIDDDDADEGKADPAGEV